MKKIIATLLVASLFAAAPMASMAAAPCRDAKAKFVKCPPKPTAPAKKAPCRDAKGKFIKCKA